MSRRALVVWREFGTRIRKCRTPRILAWPARRRKRDQFPIAQSRLLARSAIGNLQLAIGNFMMDDTPTAPDVIRGEAPASVERPLARVPLVLHHRNFSWITERISGVV